MTRNTDSLGMILVLLLVSSLTTTALAVDVKLRERVVPKSSVVRLVDVAEVVAADRQQARQLAAVPLMPTPAPDTERFLRKREIADMLAANGVEVGDIRFDGAEQVAVAAPASVRLASAQEVASDDANTIGNRHAAILAGASVPATAKATTTKLDESRAAELREQFGRVIADYVNAKVGQVGPRRVDCNVPDRQLALLDRATSAPMCEGGGEPWTGRQKFSVSFATAEGMVHVPVNADVAGSMVQVVVAIRPVARGNPITAADVEMRSIESNSKMKAQRPVVESVEKIIGLEARQSITAGEVVYADQVQSPVLVKRGDLVSVVSQSGGIRVRTSAKSLQDGAQGELVQMESLGVKKARYDARVVGLREAAVYAPAQGASSPPARSVQTARRLTPGK